MYADLLTDIVCGSNTIDSYLQKGIDINYNQGFYLELAVENNHLHIVKHLIKKGIDINSRNSYAIILAIKNNYTHIGKYLIEQGIILYPELIFLASKYNSLDILKLIINKNINCNISECIKTAVKEGNIRIIRFFFNKYPYIVKPTITTMIQLVASKGYLHIVKYFIYLSQGITTINFLVIESMISSCKHSKLNILKYITRYYMNYLSYNDLNNIYIISVENDCCISILKQLKKTKKIECYRKALEISVESSYTTLINYLVKLCTIDDINNAFLKVKSLLIAKCLINNGADIHYLEESALKNAIINNNIDLVYFLIDNGANVTINHEEPLIISIQSDVSFDIINLLIDNGANLDIAADTIISVNNPDLGFISKLTALYNNIYLYKTRVTDTECGICLTELHNKDKLFRCTVCRHTVHRLCQYKWGGKCIYCRN